MRRIGSTSRFSMRSARRACLYGAAILVVLQIIVVAIFHEVPQFGDPIFGARADRLQQRLRADPGERPLTIVALGSSRVQNGVSGQVIEKIVEENLHRRCVCFNFGFPWEGPITEHLYLQRLIDQGIRPDLLIVDVFPLYLIDIDRRPIEATRLEPERIRRTEAASLSRYGFDKHEIQRAHREAAISPWTRLRCQMLSRSGDRLIPAGNIYQNCGRFDDTGWLPIDAAMSPVEGRSRRVARQVTEFAPYLADWQPSARERQALRDLLALARVKGIPTLLVAMPSASEFRMLLSEKSRLRVAQLHAELRRDFGVAIVDAEGWLPNSEFNDALHLYSRGAEFFTRRFCAEEIVPLLERESTALSSRRK
jgi:hypothetical protein